MTLVFLGDGSGKLAFTDKSGMAHRKRKLLAIERIQRFLSLWQDADSDIPIHRAGKDKRA
jgi:hypothetical protein